MKIQIEIDQNLLDEAMNLGKHDYRETTIETALKEYIARKNRTQMKELLGSIENDPDYDFKKLR
jgi:metal-responsive CopG/Arc/MetJ family transcriptional regulator